MKKSMKVLTMIIGLLITVNLFGQIEIAPMDTNTNRNIISISLTNTMVVANDFGINYERVIAKDFHFTTGYARMLIAGETDANKFKMGFKKISKFKNPKKDRFFKDRFYEAEAAIWQRKDEVNILSGMLRYGHRGQFAENINIETAIGLGAGMTLEDQSESMMPFMPLYDVTLKVAYDF